MKEPTKKKVVMNDMVIPSKKVPPISSPQKIISPAHSEHDPVEVVYHGDQPDNRAPKKMGCAVWLVATLCGGMLTLVIGGLFSGAKLSIHTRSFSGTVDTSVTLSQAAGASLRFFTAVKTFSDKEIVTTTESVAKDAFATGTVRFFNASAKSITIPNKTRLIVVHHENDSLFYVTQAAVTVPAASKTIPGQKDIAVTALAVGRDFNQPLGDIFLEKTIPGISVRMKTSFTGGAQTSEKIIDPDTLATVSQQLILKNSNTDQLIARAQESVPSDMVVLPISLVSSVPTITTESHDDGVHVVAKRSVGLIFVKKTDMAKYLGGFINESKGVTLTMDNLEGLTITTSVLASPQTIPQTIPIRITGNGTLTGFVDAAKIKAVVLGNTRSQVKSLLSTLPEVEKVDISMVPFWRRVFPLDPTKVTVTIY